MERMYYSITAMIAIIVHIILNFELLKKKNSKESSSAYAFKQFIIVVFLYYISDMLWGIIGTSNIPLFYIDTSFIFILITLTVLCWARYVSSYLSIHHVWRNIFYVVGALFSFTVLVALFVNIFNPILFFVDEAGEYQVSHFRYVFFGLAIISFLLSIVVILIDLCTKRSNRIFTLLISSLSMVVTLVLQIVFPTHPIYTMGLLVSVLLLHVFIQEDEKNEIQTILVENEKRLAENQDIITNAGYGIWKIRMRGNGKNTMEINDKLAEILGISDIDMNRYEIYRFYHSRLLEDLDEIENKDYIQMKEGELKSRVLKWNHPTKGMIYLIAGGTRHVEANGEEIISGYCGDITKERKESERLNKELEKAMNEAKSANLAKSRFLFNMSHDIRTPMNAIIGFTDLLDKYYGDEVKCRSYISKIKDASDFLLSLINNVLEMARIESGKEVLQENICDVNQFLKTIDSIFHSQMEKKHITFTMDSHLEHTLIYGDAVKLREIYLNILSNAFKYTNEGGSVRLTIDETDFDGENVYYSVVVSDTGIGMSKEFIPTIFDEFSRERTVTDTKIEGTGLGMPIVKRFLDLMGGIITVESELGKGSTFTIQIKHRVASERKENEISSVDISYFSNKKVLLAEDNDLNAEIVMELLKEFDIIVSRARDGLECIEMLENSKKDEYVMILMDIQMPNLNGYEATKRIRQFENEKSNIPILAMTANAFEEDKKKAYECGMNGHIAKPIDIKEMLHEFSKVIH